MPFAGKRPATGSSDYEYTQSRAASLAAVQLSVCRPPLSLPCPPPLSSSSLPPSLSPWPLARRRGRRERHRRKREGEEISECFGVRLLLLALTSSPCMPACQPASLPAHPARRHPTRVQTALELARGRSCHPRDLSNGSLKILSTTACTTVCPVQPHRPRPTE
ncbi:hypothetical protein GGS23DRAFT_278339 [Durotheca rogersii]|uniref:uncharacterized protein n=1 Tax=Durotheca rogersii TaxID=419775 RepID=UPI00221E391B|nr:uncharacterized protein GGS23DRAFT_278339 [Durotheca rogersii]KAI5866586.1 hypothetical protein GGS23DRAFT_278339 [Durotheca rogersii]